MTPRRAPERAVRLRPSGDRGAGLLTPFGVVSLARGDEQGYGLGATLAVGRRATVSLEAERRRRLTSRAIYAVMLRGMLQF